MLELCLQLGERDAVGDKMAGFCFVYLMIKVMAKVAENKYIFCPNLKCVFNCD